jgi:hypothetical protein
LKLYPENTKTKDGKLFWSAPKRLPKKAIFQPKSNLNQKQFILAAAYLRAQTFKLPIPSPESLDFIITKALDKTPDPKFVLKNAEEVLKLVELELL